MDVAAGEPGSPGMVDSLVSWEPGRPLLFACGQPGPQAQAGKQTYASCMRPTWLSSVQAPQTAPICRQWPLGSLKQDIEFVGIV
jgi:hypothetical protein